MKQSSKVLKGSFERGIIGRLVDRISIWNERRKAVQQLNMMSDRLLRDIGIDRSDIDAAVKRPADYSQLPSTSTVAPISAEEISKAA